MATPFRIHLLKESNWVRLWQLLKLATEGAYRHNCLSVAKGAAYSALLSFFPVLTTVATLLVQARAESVSRTIARFLYEVVPPGTEDVVRDLFVVHGERPKWLLVVAVLLAAWAASGAMISLMEGFDVIYQISSGAAVPASARRRYSAGADYRGPVVGASALIVFGTRVERAAISSLRLLPEGADLSGWVLLAGQVLRYGVAFGTVVMVTGAGVLLRRPIASRRCAWCFRARRWPLCCGCWRPWLSPGTCGTWPITTCCMAAWERDWRCWCGCTCWR